MAQPSIPQILSQRQEIPQSFNNRECKYTYPYAALSSDLKIVGLGVYDSQVNGKTGVFYPFGIGAPSSILNMSLMAGGETIEYVRNVGELLTLEYLRTSNQNSEDINRFDVLNSVNLGLNPSSGAMTYNDPRVDYFHTYGTSSDNSNYCPGGLAWQINNTSDDKSNVTGVLHLRDIFGFLRSTNVIPPINNLHVRIEWERNGTRFPQDPRVVADGTNAIASVAPLPNPPLFVYDVVEGEMGGQNTSEIPYTTVERESFSIAANGTDEQDVTLLAKGIKNKYVESVTLLTQVPSLTSAQTYPFNSMNYCPLQNGEVINFTVNSRPWLPRQGINSPALKQYFFNKVHSLLNVNYAAFSGVTDPSGRFLDAVDPYSDNINGGYSPTAVDLGLVVEDLQINYHRDGGTNAKTSSAMNLVSLSKIAKKALINNGNVKIVS